VGRHDPPSLFTRYPRVVTSPHYRCSSCGNLTRFDVVTTSTVRAYHHFTVGGDVEIEDLETISESVDSVECRWCGHGRSIERVEPGSSELGDTAPSESVE